MVLNSISHELQKNLLVFLFCVSSIALSIAQEVKGKRIYVEAASSAVEADGQSWQTAYNDLQQALLRSASGDSIWVAKGLYFPTNNGDRNKTFKIPNGVKLFGGFKGSEKSLNERDWLSRPSILSGEIGNTANNSDNSVHVITLTNPDSTNIIDGFIIEKGYAISNIVPNNRGGGLWIDSLQKGSKIKLKDCIFRDNVAGLGGGVAVVENGLNKKSCVEIKNCIFQRNSTKSGGAIYCEFNDPASVILISGCDFELNKADGFGAAVRHLFSGSLQIVNCNFDRNENSDTGIIRSDNTDGMVTVQDCKFDSDYLGVGGVIDIYSIGRSSELTRKKREVNIRRNIFLNILGRSDAGAIYFSENGENSNNNIIIEDCVIEKSGSSLGANGIKIEKNTASSNIDCNINRCVFSENTISRKLFGIVNFINYSGKGNAIKGTINNSLFYKNTGPVIYTSQYSDGKIELQILNSTFFGNKQGEVVKDARAAAAQISVHLQNSIFHTNQTSLSTILQNTTAATIQGFSFNHCLFSVPACTSTGDTTGCGLGNIFGQYPKFVDSTSIQGLQLASGSVAINKGRWHSELTALDALGQPRVQDCRVDLGAYESPSILRPDDTLRVKVQVRSTPINMSLGELDIQQIGGGFPPYRIRWENGDSMKVRSKLAAGQYTLTISDQMGCFKIYTYIIPFTTPINELAKVRERVHFVPNPQTKGQKISMHYEGLYPGQWEIQISDFSGKVLARQNHLLQVKGVLNFPQEFELPAGMYLINLRKDAHVLSAKLVITQ